MKQHVIKKQKLNITTYAGEHSLGSRSGVSGLYNKRLLSVINNVFDEFSVPDSVIKIARLDLDLGVFYNGQLEGELEDRLAAKLRHALGAAISEINFSPDENNKILTMKASTLDLFELFLLYGVLPKGHGVEDRTSPGELFEKLMGQTPMPLVQMVKKHKGRQTVLERLSRQFEEKLLVRFTSLLAPKNGSIIIDYLRDLKAAHRKKPFVNKGPTEFEQDLWSFVLTYLLEDKGLFFERKVFVKRLIGDLARKYRMGYSELLNFMRSSLERLPRDFAFKSSLPTIIGVLHSENIKRFPSEDGFFLAPGAPGRDAAFKIIEALIINGESIGVQQGKPGTNLLFSWNFLFENYAEKARELALKTASNKAAFQRLLRALPAHEIAQTLGPANFAMINSIVSGIVRVHELHGLFKINAKSLLTVIWEFVVVHLLMEARGHFNEKHFLKTLLIKLSDRFHISYPDLVQALYTGEEKEGHGPNAGPPLPQLAPLYSLVRELAVEVEKEEKFLRTPEKEDAAAFSYYGKLDALRYFLRTGLLPWDFSLRSPEEGPENLMASLLTDRPELAAALLEGPGGRTSILKKVSKRFSESILIDLILAILQKGRPAGKWDLFNFKESVFKNASMAKDKDYYYTLLLEAVLEQKEIDLEDLARSQPQTSGPSGDETRSTSEDVDTLDIDIAKAWLIHYLKLDKDPEDAGFSFESLFKKLTSGPVNGLRLFLTVLKEAPFLLDRLSARLPLSLLDKTIEIIQPREAPFIKKYARILFLGLKEIRDQRGEISEKEIYQIIFPDWLAQLGKRWDAASFVRETMYQVCNGKIPPGFREDLADRAGVGPLQLPATWVRALKEKALLMKKTPYPVQIAGEKPRPVKEWPEADRRLFSPELKQLLTSFIRFIESGVLPMETGWRLGPLVTKLLGLSRKEVLQAVLGLLPKNGAMDKEGQKQLRDAILKFEGLARDKGVFYRNLIQSILGQKDIDFEELEHETTHETSSVSGLLKKVEGQKKNIHSLDSKEIVLLLGFYLETGKLPETGSFSIGALYERLLDAFPKETAVWLEVLKEKIFMKEHFIDLLPFPLIEKTIEIVTSDQGGLVKKYIRVLFLTFKEGDYSAREISEKEIYQIIFPAWLAQLGKKWDAASFVRETMYQVCNGKIPPGFQEDLADRASVGPLQLPAAWVRALKEKALLRKKTPYPVQIAGEKPRPVKEWPEAEGRLFSPELKQLLTPFMRFIESGVLPMETGWRLGPLVTKLLGFSRKEVLQAVLGLLPKSGAMDKEGQKRLRGAILKFEGLARDKGVFYRNLIQSILGQKEIDFEAMVSETTYGPELLKDLDSLEENIHSLDSKEIVLLLSFYLETSKLPETGRFPIGALYERLLDAFPKETAVWLEVLKEKIFFKEHFIDRMPLPLLEKTIEIVTPGEAGLVKKTIRILFMGFKETGPPATGISEKEIYQIIFPAWLAQLGRQWDAAWFVGAVLDQACGSKPPPGLRADLEKRAKREELPLLPARTDDMEEKDTGPGMEELEASAPEMSVPEISATVIASVPETETYKPDAREEEAGDLVLNFLTGEETSKAGLDKTAIYFQLEKMLCKPTREFRAFIKKNCLESGLRDRWVSILPEHLLIRFVHLLQPLDLKKILDCMDMALEAWAGTLTIRKTAFDLKELKWGFILKSLAKSNFVGFDEGRFLKECIEDLIAVSKKKKARINEEQIKERMREIIREKGKGKRLYDKLQDFEQTKQEMPGEVVKEDRKKPKPKEKEDERLSEGIKVQNAGLALLAPFIPDFLERAGLKMTTGEKDETYVSGEAAFRAVHLLQYAVDERTDAQEYELTLNKILCGVQLAVAIDKGIEITEEEKDTVESLLKGVIQNWEIISQGTSVQGFRESFLQREGVLQLTEKGWELKVEPKPFDMLLDHIPWSFSMTAFTWMEKPLHVEWRGDTK